MELYLHPWIGYVIGGLVLMRLLSMCTASHSIQIYKIALDSLLPRTNPIPAPVEPTPVNPMPTLTSDNGGSVQDDPQDGTDGTTSGSFSLYGSFVVAITVAAIVAAIVSFVM